MKLIADNGGTKTIWIAIDGEQHRSLETKGLYPFFSTDEHILSIFKQVIDFFEHSFQEIYFYSTGCRMTKQRNRLKSLIQKSFASAQTIEVDTDIMAAARSLCQKDSGIACIMGTGSHSCLFDGRQIIGNAGGFGYVLGDEGGGASLGKELLKAYLNKQLPDDLNEAFETAFNMDRDQIFASVYENDTPNRFLASFGPFLHQHRAHSFIRQLILNDFQLFFQNNILIYSDYLLYPIHILGSIAYYFEEELKIAAAAAGTAIASVKKDPIPGLINYHQ